MGSILKSSFESESNLHGARGAIGQGQTTLFQAPFGFPKVKVALFASRSLQCSRTRGSISQRLMYGVPEFQGGGKDGNKKGNTREERGFSRVFLRLNPLLSSEKKKPPFLSAFEEEKRLRFIRGFFNDG